MYERKIAELIKQLEDQHLLYRSEQEKLVEAKKHLNEHQRSMQVLILHLLKSQIVCSYSFRTFIMLWMMLLSLVWDQRMLLSVCHKHL